MKCPYRIIITRVKPANPTTLNTSTGMVTIKSIENTDFEECYGVECPYYNPDAEYEKVYCKKVVSEIGEPQI